MADEKSNFCNVTIEMAVKKSIIYFPFADCAVIKNDKKMLN